MSESDVDAIVEERGGNYGHPIDHFHCTQSMFNAWLEKRDKSSTFLPEKVEHGVRHSVYLILDKLARLAENPHHRDNLDDIQGYAKCMGMVLDTDGDYKTWDESIEIEEKEQLRVDRERRLREATCPECSSKSKHSAHYGYGWRAVTCGECSHNYTFNCDTGEYSQLGSEKMKGPLDRVEEILSEHCPQCGYPSP